MADVTVIPAKPIRRRFRTPQNISNKRNQDWSFGGIFVDEGISSTNEWNSTERSRTVWPVNSYRRFPEMYKP